MTEIITTDLEREFAAAIERAGLSAPTSIIADGELHRFATSSKASDDAGWYVLHGDPINAGAFGCWRQGFTEKFKLPEDDESDEQAQDKKRKRRERAMKQAVAKGRAERERRQHEAAKIAQDAWRKAKPAPVDHPYLVKKQVKPHGLRVDADDQLVIPMKADGSIVSLQVIDSDGDKRFIPGGRVQGAYYPIGTVGDILYIAEGFATAASVHEVTGDAVAVAFNAGNLVSVAKALREKFKDADIVLAADNDLGGETNVGIDKATAAAKAVGVRAAVPELDDVKCDFNDVYCQRGAETVRTQLARASLPSAACASAHRSPENYTESDTKPMHSPLHRSASVHWSAAAFIPEPPKLAAKPNILADFRAAVAASGVVGEQSNAALLYLALTSRLLDKPVSVAVKGHSASGKSYTAQKVVSFFPEEAVVEMTGMSEHALIYSE